MFFSLAGPVQHQLMPSPDGQAYRPPGPASYSHQAPAKVPPHQSSGQYNYGGSQLNNYQGPGQTLNRPAPPFSGSPAQQTGPAPQVLLPPLQSAAAASSAGGFAPGASPAVLSDWQHGQAAASQALGAQAHGTGTGSAQPSSLAGNTNPAGSYPYAASPGGPPLQNSFVKPGNHSSAMLCQCPLLSVPL